MPHVIYQLKIESAFDHSIYRTVQIAGSRTFADLSDWILDSFEFDKEHLYMFSLNRRPYVPDSIYHPMAKRGKRADRVRLQDVNPAVKNKYLYLYDFGDDWMFYITVMEIKETDRDMPIKLIHSQGKLCQYPNWEEEWDDEEEYYNENACEEDLCASMEDLVISLVNEEDT